LEKSIEWESISSEVVIVNLDNWSINSLYTDYPTEPSDYFINTLDALNESLKTNEIETPIERVTNQVYLNF